MPIVSTLNRHFSRVSVPDPLERTCLNLSLPGIMTSMCLRVFGSSAFNDSCIILVCALLVMYGYTQRIHDTDDRGIALQSQLNVPLVNMILYPQGCDIL